MRLVFYFKLFCLWALTLPAIAAPEVAVSMRYFQDEGVSHAHVYLYREDGKLLRQLTDEKAADDINPFFSPDGSVILFTRCIPGSVSYWSIEPVGKNLQNLRTAPDWYKKVMAAGGASETSSADSDSYLNPPEKIKEDSSSDPVKTFKLPDGSTLTIDSDPNSDSVSCTILEPNKKKHPINVAVQIGAPNPPLFCTLNQPENGLKLAFVRLRLDSTNGSQTLAIDLTHFKGHLLKSEGHDLPGHHTEAPGLVCPTPLPGESAFLSSTELRYVSYGTKGKCENSIFLERWDSQFNQINYSKVGAGVLYGASLYRGDVHPNVIWVVCELPTDGPAIDPKGLNLGLLPTSKEVFPEGQILSGWRTRHLMAPSCWYGTNSLRYLGLVWNAGG